jgi:hypothetical protein
VTWNAIAWQAIELAVALGVGVFIGVLWAKGFVKSLRRRRTSGRGAVPRAERQHAAANVVRLDERRSFPKSPGAA